MCIFNAPPQFFLLFLNNHISFYPEMPPTSMSRVAVAHMYGRYVYCRQNSAPIKRMQSLNEGIENPKRRKQLLLKGRASSFLWANDTKTKIWRVAEVGINEPYCW
jgi:hypothetical protein